MYACVSPPWCHEWTSSAQLVVLELGTGSPFRESRWNAGAVTTVVTAAARNMVRQPTAPISAPATMAPRTSSGQTRSPVVCTRPGAHCSRGCAGMEPAGFSLREPERTSPLKVSSGVRRTPADTRGGARMESLPPRVGGDLATDRALERNLKVCARTPRHNPTTSDDDRRIAQQNRLDPTAPNSTQVTSCASEPAFRGSNPCLPAKHSTSNPTRRVRLVRTARRV